MSLVFEFQTVIQSRVDLLERTVEQIMNVVRALHLASDVDDVDLALTEALANAIVHGNRQDAGKSVRICVGCERTGDLVLIVTDEGHGFDHERIPDPTAGANVYSGHGRGLLLIRHVMDSVEFRLGGRRLVMRKKGGAKLSPPFPQRLNANAARQWVEHQDSFTA